MTIHPREQRETRPRVPATTFPAGRRLMTLREVASLLALSTASIRRLIASGDLPALRLTRRLLVDVHDVERVIQELKARGPWR
jgi:excisionase family DNA binding protein